MKTNYNFKNIENITNFLNEIGINVEIKECDGKINMWNFCIEETDTFKNFEELNEYANEQLSALIENNLCKDVLFELIEEFTSL